ncbi:hypothetical protein [uncultured Paraglaciecola sp.]|uniref:hypothetical protein n=1 Tax=uncultured Paraglaciecola sp. TaxID=1765024 RepID=UPI0030DBAC38|tara:strand:- start:57942 stop:58172 length:231 start_codon:yes stop_codon:yes gene_type:complete
MCSSPKSSGSSRPKVRVKGLYEVMDPDKRKRFAEVANRADERKAKRKEVSKRWESKHASQKKPSGFFSWFSQLVGS